MGYKILNSIIILLLVLLTTGFSVSRHLCGDHLVSVSVNGKTEPCCGKNSTCCDDVMIHIQLQDHFIGTDVSDVTHKPDNVDTISDILYVTSQTGNDFAHFYRISFCTNSPPIPAHRITLLQTFLL